MTICKAWEASRMSGITPQHPHSLHKREWGGGGQEEVRTAQGWLLRELVPPEDLIQSPEYPNEPLRIPPLLGRQVFHLHFNFVTYWAWWKLVLLALMDGWSIRMRLMWALFRTNDFNIGSSLVHRTHYNNPQVPAA